MKKFNEYLNKIYEKNSILCMMMWEIDTKAPKDSIDYYIDVATKLETEIFELSTSNEYIDLLNGAINSEDFEKLDEHKRIYYLDLKDRYEKNKKIPTDFYELYTKQKNMSKKIWAEAKEKKDYSIFKPYLEKNIEMTKELYRFIYPESDNLYDEMLGDYEKNIKSSDIDKLFEKLKSEITPIVKNLKPKNLKKISIEYTESEMYDISNYLLNYIGFDNNRGTLGIYPHGYTTTISKDDVRIAFNKTKDIFEHMSTIIHEGGHGIFEQYAGKEFKELNLCEIYTIALHESQSRFYENILGRNINFWIPIYDDIKKMSKLDLTIEEFIDYFNDARTSLVRTEADELTYCLHIIIRYEIERDIFNGSIDLDNLPEIWNKKYKEYLGIDVKDDSEGILQDMHWSDASFGYFPDYLLGSIFDGMLLEKINSELGDVDTILKEGKIKEITRFLNENIHKYAGSYNIFETCKRVCGKDMEVGPLIKYFKNKYERE